MIRNRGGRAVAWLGLSTLLVAWSAAASQPGCDPAWMVCTSPTGPEPATLSLLALGVAGAAIARRRK
jgi:hypothetical protein